MAVPKPLRQLAEDDHAEEDQAHDEHGLDYFLSFLSGCLRGEQHGAILLDAPSVGCERAFDQRRRGISSIAELRGGCCPCLAVAGKAVGAQLGAERDQGRELGDRLDRAALCDADEAVRVEVVAEQQSGVCVPRFEQPRPAVVEQVALVDRLEAQRVALLGERREDGLVLALALRPQRVRPKGALRRRCLRDRRPDVSSYNQPASSFVQ